jgi:hypothetical protein
MKQSGQFKNNSNIKGSLNILSQSVNLKYQQNENKDES